MPDQIFINIALLAVGVAIGALLGETSRQQHDRQLFREYINFIGTQQRAAVPGSDSVSDRERSQP